jgi:hypothetical protein
VSKGGDGIPTCDVSHSGGGPWAFVAVHPGGSAGGVTPSKSSLNVVVGWAQEAPEANTSVRAVEADPVSPPAATKVLPIAVPATLERATLRSGPLDQLSATGS